MANATAQKVLIAPNAPFPEPAAAPAPASSPLAVASPIFSIDGQPHPPQTHAQAYYWRQLCGALGAQGAQGVADAGCPADLLPMMSTLHAMSGYGIIARRGRAWHLRRAWYTRLTQLRLQAVDLTPLAPAERPGPGLPSYSELEQWETLCR
jgi:hypothetical protein